MIEMLSSCLKKIKRIHYGHVKRDVKLSIFFGYYFMLSLSGDKDAKVIEAFNSTPGHVDDLLNIDNTYFDGMVNQIYPELQLTKADSSVSRFTFDLFRWFVVAVFFSSKFMINPMVFILIL